MLGSPPAFNRTQVNADVKATDSFKKYLADNSINAYVSNRQKGVKIIKLT
jgi:hypothetical protein